MEILKLGSRGPNVTLVQGILKNLGYFLNEIDGIYGNATEDAVASFQRNFGLIPDGIIGMNTWQALNPYINGYTIYTIKPGDTLYLIAEKYGTTTNAIRTANPSILPDDYSLRVAQKILVPLSNVVPTNVSYTYRLMRKNIDSLKRIYPFLYSSNIGKSVLGNDLPYIRFGIRHKRSIF